MLFLVQVGTFALQAKCCDLACYYLVSVVGPTFYFQEFFIAPSKILYARQRKHAMILLNEPELVANTWLNFAATMWFFVSPQPPKPSMLQVLDGSWIPNSHDISSNLVPGFGTTTMIINGALECGSFSQQAQNRATYYADYAQKLGVDITGEKLLCNDMQQFSAQGSAGSLDLYWESDGNGGCKLVNWQTAYNSLVEGDYNRCRGISTSCSSESTTSSPTIPGPTSTPSPTPLPSTCFPEEATKPMKVVCYYPNWPYYRLSNN